MWGDAHIRREEYHEFLWHKLLDDYPEMEEYLSWELATDREMWALCYHLQYFTLGTLANQRWPPSCGLLDIVD